MSEDVVKRSLAWTRSNVHVDFRLVQIKWDVDGIRADGSTVSYFP